MSGSGKRDIELKGISEPPPLKQRKCTETETLSVISELKLIIQGPEEEMEEKGREVLSMSGLEADSQLFTTIGSDSELVSNFSLPLLQFLLFFAPSPSFILSLSQNWRTPLQLVATTISLLQRFPTSLSLQQNAFSLLSEVLDTTHSYP
jgi:hypothetical protein